MDQPVSICAVSCLCAAGNSAEKCFETMLNSSVIPNLPLFLDQDDSSPSPVFSVPNNYNLEQSTLPITETLHLLFNTAAEAYHKTNLSKQNANSLRIGSCIGTSTGASLNFKNFYQEWRKGSCPSMTSIHSYLHGNPAFELAKKYSFNGPIQTVTNACSSGTDAIGIGASWIKNGLCDLVFAGGADALSEISYTGFSRLMITSPDSPHPFDKMRTGLNLGEGAAILVLAGTKAMHELDLFPLAEIMGYGTHCDAYHLTAPHPEASGLIKAISEALRRSKLNASDIGFINIHGTGTINNDKVEGVAINKLFPNTPFVGIKGFTGHTLGAAGAIEAVMTILSLKHGLLMPTSGFSTQDPEIGISPVQLKTAINAEFALSQSLAFGGNNSAIIFKRK